MSLYRIVSRALIAGGCSGPRQMFAYRRPERKFSIDERLEHIKRRARFVARGRLHREMLLVACFPKSGSTYLMRLLSELTGYRREFLIGLHGPNEQDLCEYKLRRTQFVDGVCQHHVKATYFNAKFINKYRLTPIVLVRNLADVVRSLADHFDNGGALLPTGHRPDVWSEMSNEDKWMFLIRLHLPWYFNFLLTWEEADESVLVPWLRYEDLVKEPVPTLISLLRQIRHDPIDERAVQGIVERVQEMATRRNQGVAGRGQELPPAHKMAIREIAEASGVSPPTLSYVGLDHLDTSVVGAVRDPGVSTDGD